MENLLDHSTSEVIADNSVITDKAAVAKAAKAAKAQIARDKAKAAAAAKLAAANEVPIFAIATVKEKTLSPLQQANRAFAEQSGSLSFCFNQVRKLHKEFRAIIQAKSESGYVINNDLLNESLVKGNLGVLAAKIEHREKWSVASLKNAIVKAACTK